jgi:hypothetical protein
MRSDKVGDTVERAHETFHEAHHAHEHGDRMARRVAVLVSELAAALALTELGEKAAQNEYLTHHIAVSDDWAFYQAKNLRAQMRDTEVDVLASLPNAADPAVQARISAARAYAAKSRDDPKGGEGMKQIAVTARRAEASRDAAFHRYHGYELAVGALEIAIVLASVSVVTRMVALALGAGAIGAIAAVYGATVWLHLL